MKNDLFNEYKKNRYPHYFYTPVWESMRMRTDVEDAFNAGFEAALANKVEPKPCEFKKGDRVLVSHDKNSEQYRRYFKSKSPNSGLYICYINGAEEWGSNGATAAWKYCKKAEEVFKDENS